ncbi:hypothetical protein [Rhodococcus sp. ZPP]|uniref:hypothetical protein n=1 Tax=Rhodococcus sp. ZPP TaxID=2749906 RepID=UPI001FCD7786|nr:hypothetical protein [Rhodococcus sp. ZPP]
MADFRIRSRNRPDCLGRNRSGLAAVLADAAIVPYRSIDVTKDLLGPGSAAAVIGIGGPGQFAVQLLREMAGAGAAFRTAAITTAPYVYEYTATIFACGSVRLRPNPRAQQFGRFGVCYVSYTANPARLPPNRRGVLTAVGNCWVIDCLEQWIEHARPAFGRESAALFPTEWSDRISAGAIY